VSNVGTEAREREGERRESERERYTEQLSDSMLACHWMLTCLEKDGRDEFTLVASEAIVLPS
jgi:hypothetical protein